jgi:hypothetical protein
MPPKAQKHAPVPTNCTAANRSRMENPLPKSSANHIIVARISNATLAAAAGIAGQSQLIVGQSQVVVGTAR